MPRTLATNSLWHITMYTISYCVTKLKSYILGILYFHNFVISNLKYSYKQYPPCILVIRLIMPNQPMSLTTLSKTWFRGGSFAGTTCSKPARSCFSVLECCMLPGRAICDGLIPFPEESHWVGCVFEFPH
jgi:hypothetical protein